MSQRETPECFGGEINKLKLNIRALFSQHVHARSGLLVDYYYRLDYCSNHNAFFFSGKSKVVNLKAYVHSIN